MSAFSKIRQSFGTKSLIGKQKKLERRRVVHNFNTAKNTAIIFDVTDPETFRHVRDFSKFLEKMKIKAGMLGYVPTDEVPNDLLLWENCQVFCNKHLDYWFRPNDDSIQKFIDKEYDILFDLSMKDYFPVTFVSTLSRARFKVGRYKEKLNDTDFMFDIHSEPTVDFLIVQIKNYISILNNPEKTGKVPTR